MTLYYKLEEDNNNNKSLSGLRINYLPSLRQDKNSDLLNLK